MARGRRRHRRRRSAASSPQAQFTALWASVVVVTAASLILYNVIQIVEDVVLARMGMHPQKSI